MDARLRPQHRHGHALLAPLIGADHAQQLAQRHRLHTGITAGRTPGLGAGFAPVGCTAQLHAVIGLQRHQQAVQHPRALPLGLAVQVEGLGRADRLRARARLAPACGLAGRLARGLAGRLARGLVQAALERIQQVPRVLEVSLPQQGRALARQAVGGIGGQGVVRHHHAARRGQAAFTAPSSLVVNALVVPVQHGNFLGQGTKKSARRSGPWTAISSRAA